MTFRQSLLVACQNYFETSLASMELSAEETDGLAPEEIWFEKTRRKNCLLAMIRFVGHLFVGNLKFFEYIANDLISQQHDSQYCASDDKAECVLELLQIVQKKFGKRSDGMVLIHKLNGWLMNRQLQIANDDQEHFLAPPGLERSSIRTSSSSDDDQEIFLAPPGLERSSIRFSPLHCAKSRKTCSSSLTASTCSSEPHSDIERELLAL